MALKVAEEMRRTPLTEKNAPNSSSKATPGKSKKVTPLKSNPSTPLRGILKTPTSGKRGSSRLEPDTPISTKKRVKKTLIKISENDVTHNYSDNSSDTDDDTQEDESEEEDKPIMKGPPATPRTPARRGRRQKSSRDLDQHNMAESYFAAQGPVLTSDRTLAKLKTPRLSDMEVTKLLKTSKQKYDHEVSKFSFNFLRIF